MTVVARRRVAAMQQRGFSIAQGGFGGWIGDPSVIPPPSAFSMGTAGVTVNERTVLSLMVVAACLRVIADAVSGLEPHVYRQKGSRRDPTHDKEIDPPSVIVAPYADIDREEGDFNRVASLCLNGNILTHVVDRAGGSNGNPVQVEVLNPGLVKVEMVKGQITYKFGAAGKTIPSQDVVHKKWESLPGGLTGLNPIEIGVNGFGIPIAAEQYASRYFAQGMHPTGILSLDKPLRPGDSKRVEQELQVKHGGLAQAFTPIVLDSAAKWTQISITPETAQLLQSRSFSRAEISGFYGVPPHLVGDTDDKGGPWGKGLQEMVISFSLFGLSGYARRLDRGDSDLLPAGYYVHRKVSDLFKTNDQMLGQYVSMLRQAALVSPDEGRAIIGLPPANEPGSGSIFAPINSAHADFLAAGDEGAESGLPGSKNPKGIPTGTTQGGSAATEPQGGQ